MDGLSVAAMAIGAAAKAAPKKESVYKTRGPQALAARIAEASKSFLMLDTVSFKIEFYRPAPHAKIVVDRSIGGDRELIAGVSFMVNTDDMMAGKFNDLLSGDRREVTTIGYKTLMKVAEVLKS